MKTIPSILKSRKARLNEVKLDVKGENKHAIQAMTNRMYFIKFSSMNYIVGAYRHEHRRMRIEKKFSAIQIKIL